MHPRFQTIPFLSASDWGGTCWAVEIGCFSVVFPRKHQATQRPLRRRPRITNEYSQINTGKTGDKCVCVFYIIGTVMFPGSPVYPVNYTSYRETTDRQRQNRHADLFEWVEPHTFTIPSQNQASINLHWVVRHRDCTGSYSCKDSCFWFWKDREES